MARRWAIRMKAVEMSLAMLLRMWCFFALERLVRGVGVVRSVVQWVVEEEEEEGVVVVDEGDGDGENRGCRRGRRGGILFDFV